MDPRAAAAIERLTGVAKDAAERCLRAASADDATRAAIEALGAVDWVAEGEIPLPSELTDEQRDVATALAFRADLGRLPEGAGIDRFRIPLTARNRRQWLGIAPGVLEQVDAYDRGGEAASEPRWRRYRWLHPQGAAPRGSIKEALAELEPTDRFRAYVELGLGAYGLHTQDPELQSLAAEHGKALGTWARQVADEVREHELPVPDDVKAALLHAIVAARLPSSGATERFFVLDPAHPDRNVAFVNALAPERREPLLAAAAASGVASTAIDAACTVLGAFPYPSVAKIVGDRFADTVEAARAGRHHPALDAQIDARQERLRKLAADRPALASALKRAVEAA